MARATVDIAGDRPRVGFSALAATGLKRGSSRFLQGLHLEMFVCSAESGRLGRGRSVKQSRNAKQPPSNVPVAVVLALRPMRTTFSLESAAATASDRKHRVSEQRARVG